ncbi:hypothetical protein BFS12_06150 [Gardnerella vaginalis]|nr:hypothetical protein BFS12_06150 [Gardnerella vaginalis]
MSTLLSRNKGKNGRVSSEHLKKIKRSPVGKRRPTGAERKREEGFSYGVRERTSLMDNHQQYSL